jgi:hypothetical protein
MDPRFQATLLKFVVICKNARSYTKITAEAVIDAANTENTTSMLGANRSKHSNLATPCMNDQIDAMHITLFVLGHADCSDKQLLAPPLILSSTPKSLTRSAIKESVPTQQTQPLQQLLTHRNKRNRPSKLSHLPGLPVRKSGQHYQL